MSYCLLTLLLIFTHVSSHQQTYAVVHECFDHQGKRIFTDSPVSNERCAVLSFDEQGQKSSDFTASKESPNVTAPKPFSSSVDNLDFVAKTFSPLVKSEQKVNSQDSYTSSVKATNLPSEIAQLVKQGVLSIDDVPLEFPTE